MATIFSPHIQMMINKQNKNVRQLVWHLQYVDTVVEGSELHCYNIEGDRNSVVSEASCRMDVTQLELDMSKFTHFEAGGIPRLPHHCQRIVDAWGDYFEGV